MALELSANKRKMKEETMYCVIHIGCLGHHLKNDIGSSCLGSYTSYTVTLPIPFL